jgi:CheY-like chemotaxis protein
VYAVKPVDRQWLLDHLARLTAPERPCILLIDDDEVARYLLKQLFGGLPHRFLEAADGATGLELAYSVRPDLVFLDLMMPGVNGFEVLAKLREEPGTRRTPVVVASSKILTAAESHLLEQEHAFLLQKDLLSGSEVERRLREILSQAGLSHLLRSPGESVMEAQGR